MGSKSLRTEDRGRLVFALYLLHLCLPCLVGSSLRSTLRLLGSFSLSVLGLVWLFKLLHSTSVILIATTKPLSRSLMMNG